MDKELNEDARTKQDLLYECNGLESRLSNEIIKNENLKQQCKKQKEVIDKTIEYIEKFIPIDEDTILMRERQRDYLLDILKEVSEWK